MFKMKTFLLFLSFLQYFSYTTGACPTTVYSPEMNDIWNELTELNREMDDEIDIHTLKYLNVLLKDADPNEYNAFARFKGKSNAICDWSFGKAEADVVCKSLGLRASTRFKKIPLKEDAFPAEFRCEGWERTLGECRLINKTGQQCENGVHIACDKSGQGKREQRFNCHCDCKMKGFPGLPGRKGNKGVPGVDGLQGPKGDKGRPGRARIAPAGPSPYDDKAFVEKLKLRWKGYSGPYGREGSTGEPGEHTKCDCSKHEEVCRTRCQPQKGEKGSPGLPGLPGLDGLPGLPGEDALQE